MACASIVLDRNHYHLATRLSNKTYENCRQGLLTLNAFSDFATPIAALKAGHQRQEVADYQVCKQRGSSLVILEAYASKFLEVESLKDKTMEIINAHNSVYNHDGSFLQSERQLIDKMYYKMLFPS